LSTTETDFFFTENSHDEELDAILGELSELETQFSREIGQEPQKSRANGGSNLLAGLRKVKNTPKAEALNTMGNF
jgi:hypothetical protein